MPGGDTRGDTFHVSDIFHILVMLVLVSICSQGDLLCWEAKVYCTEQAIEKVQCIRAMG